MICAQATMTLFSGAGLSKLRKGNSKYDHGKVAQYRTSTKRTGGCKIICIVTPTHPLPF